MSKKSKNQFKLWWRWSLVLRIPAALVLIPLGYMFRGLDCLFYKICSMFFSLSGYMSDMEDNVLSLTYTVGQKIDKLFKE